MEMNEKRLDVRASELPVCPFCNGAVYYDNWLTHRLFQMECETCKSHWRTGIARTEEREMFVELVSTKNPDVSNEYIQKQLPLEYWQNLTKQLK